MTNERRREVRFPLRLLAGILLLSVVLPRAAETGVSASDRWYLLSIAGQPAGSLRERVVEEGETVRVSSEGGFVLNRMGSKVETRMTVESRETRAGRLQGLDLDLRMSTQTMSTKVTVEEGVVRIRDEAGGRGFERTVPFSGELLGPEGLRRLSAARLAKPGDRVEARTWVAELGAVHRIVRTVAAEEEVATSVGPVRTLRVEEETEGKPGKRTLWLDRDGGVVQSAEPGPFGEVRAVWADEAGVRKALAAAGDLPAEMYGRSLVRTAVRLPDPRRIERLVLRLRHRQPSLGWPELEGPGQRVLERSADAVTVEIRRPQPAAGQQLFALGGGEPAAEDRRYLAANAYLQPDDPGIRAAALAAVAGEKDAFAAGLKLQRWVAEAMRFDFGIVFAPSTEVFANRRGTCAGYAMLLTAMARAVGLPARYVMGYVYVDGFFGGHAWTEIRVGKDWIPLDAAVPSAGPADATHLALFRTSLDEGVGGLGAGPLLQLYGQLAIDVLSVTVEGRPEWKVPEAAPSSSN